MYTVGHIGSSVHAIYTGTTAIAAHFAQQCHLPILRGVVSGSVSGRGRLHKGQGVLITTPSMVHNVIT